MFSRKLFFAKQTHHSFTNHKIITHKMKLRGPLALVNFAITLANPHRPQKQRKEILITKLTCVTIKKKKLNDH